MKIHDSNWIRMNFLYSRWNEPIGKHAAEHENVDPLNPNRSSIKRSWAKKFKERRVNQEFMGQELQSKPIGRTSESNVKFRPNLYGFV